MLNPLKLGSLCDSVIFLVVITNQQLFGQLRKRELQIPVCHHHEASPEHLNALVLEVTERVVALAFSHSHAESVELVNHAG